MPERLIYPLSDGPEFNPLRLADLKNRFGTLDGVPQKWLRGAAPFMYFDTREPETRGDLGTILWLKRRGWVRVGRPGVGKGTARDSQDIQRGQYPSLVRCTRTTPLVPATYHRYVHPPGHQPGYQCHRLLTREHELSDLTVNLSLRPVKSG